MLSLMNDDNITLIGEIIELVLFELLSSKIISRSSFMVVCDGFWCAFLVGSSFFENNV
jgi:hypothetical protein